MARRMALWATAVVLAGLGAAYLLGRRGGGPDAVPVEGVQQRGPEAPREAKAPPLAAHRASVLAPDGPASPAPTSPEPAAPRALRPRHAVLHVLVTDEPGAAVAGAEVAVHGIFEWDGATPRPSVRAAGRTGSDGRLDLEVPVSPEERAWPGPVLVHAWADGLAALSAVVDPWAPDPKDVGRADVRLVLARATVISGRVASDVGAPVSGASVVAVDGDELRLGSTAGADGEFRFPPIPTARLGPSVLVRAEAPGFMPGDARVEPPWATRADVRLVLSATRSVRARVVGAMGTGVGTPLNLDPESEESWLFLGAFLGVPWSAEPDGRVVLSRLPAHDTTVVVVPPPPFAPREVRVPAGTTDLGDVVVETGGRVRGRLVVGDDEAWIRPGLGWWVTCDSETLGRTVRAVQADHEGVFEFDGLGPGEHVIRTVLHSHTLDAPIASGEARGVRVGDGDVHLLVEPCGLLRLRAFTAQDRAEVAVPGWRVEATGPLPASTRTVRTAPDRGRDRSEPMGGFVVGLPRPGTYHLRVKIPGFAWVEATDVPVDRIDETARDLLLVPERR